MEKYNKRKKTKLVNGKKVFKLSFVVVFSDQSIKKFIAKVSW